MLDFRCENRFHTNAKSPGLFAKSSCFDFIHRSAAISIGKVTGTYSKASAVGTNSSSSIAGSSLFMDANDGTVIWSVSSDGVKCLHWKSPNR